MSTRILVTANAAAALVAIAFACVAFDSGDRFAGGACLLLGGTTMVLAAMIHLYDGHDDYDH